mmetsp:Transcript_38659/g.99934  ORF Transcript_38659/g.99934 Transcript_38659/m.99934 type:complete len:687 (-) Transcript_38659:15-2075(-)
MSGEKEKPRGAKICNVNIGILGHIDSGKTSLCRALSTITSTASLDKHPQSQERGITLDLGFSAFSSDAPEHFKAAGYESMQFCLVDCPGHASLIKTVIGGAQIIDLCILVIDANKGIQAQTAECLVIAEILANQLVIVLNKVDMIAEAKRQKTLDKIIKSLRGVFAQTAFGANLPFACVSASPAADPGNPALGVPELVELLKSKLEVPKRDPSGPFMFSFDHAFAIKGQGTVMTGTVLSGSVKPGMPIVVPALGEAGRGKKVRSLQMFKQPVQEAIQGDRVAMCVAALDAKELERGIVIAEKFPLPTLDACICVVNRLSYFKAAVLTKAKFHVTLGHQTVMATAHFFCPLGKSVAESGGGSSGGSGAVGGAAGSSGAGAVGSSAKPPKGGDGSGGCMAMGFGALVANSETKWPTTFDMSGNYLHLDECFQQGAPIEYENTDGDAVKISPGPVPGKLAWTLNGESKPDILELKFDGKSGRLTMNGGMPLGSTVDSKSSVPLKDRDRVIYLLKWMAQSCQVLGLDAAEEPLSYVLLLLERPVQCPLGSLLIGSKLDSDIHSPTCRMAFFGRILTAMDPKGLKSLKLVRMKSKVGKLDRFDKQDSTLVICKDMFKADTDMQLFLGLKVVHEASGTQGILEGTYGQEGLFKVRFPCELKVKADNKGHIKDETITLFFKKFDFMHNKGFIQ